MREAFGHSLVLVGFYAVLPITIGLVLTALMSHARVRGSTAVRTIIFLPQVLAAVVIGVAWKWLYDPQGPINSLLGAVGLSSLEHSWLGDFTTALPAVGVIGTWVTTGLCLVLFMAGVQRIPLSRYEAARVDGAGPVREFFAVTLPGLRNELAVAMSLTVITALRAFDIIFVTTKGGPGIAHDGAVAADLPARVRDRRGGLGGRDRGDHGRDHPAAVGRDHAGGRGADGEHRQRSSATATYVMLALFSVLALVPRWWSWCWRRCTRPATLLSGAEPARLVQPGTPSARPGTRATSASLMTSSMIVAVTVVALTTVLSIPAGYAFGTMRFPFADLLFYVILTGIVVPFESLIVPLYYSFRNVGLTDSYWGLILPQTGLSISFGMFWMRAFFRSLPPELSDAARVDGATSWRILWRVLVPIGRPAILTMVLLVFMWTWNEFLLALVMISDESHRTAPLGLSAFQSRYGVDIPGVSAAAVFVAAPVVILYVLTPAAVPARHAGRIDQGLTCRVSPSTRS